MAAKKVGNRYAGSALVSINASTSTGAGDSWDLKAGFTNFSVTQFGDSTGWQADLQGSIDGTHWVNLSTNIGASTAPTVTRSTTTYPVQHVRMLATAGTTSTAVAVTSYICCG